MGDEPRARDGPAWEMAFGLIRPRREEREREDFWAGVWEELAQQVFRTL